MTRKALLAISAVTLCFAAISARADWDVDDYKWAQLPDEYGWDVNATTPNLLFDDFLCRDMDPITDIHLWGSWKDDQVGEITRLHLSIHESTSPNSLDGASPFLLPGDVVWERDFIPSQMDNVEIQEWGSGIQGWLDPVSGEYLRYNHELIWQINVFLDYRDWFWQQGSLEYPVTYWLDVQVDVASTDTVFGWKTSINHWHSDGLYMSPTGGLQELIDPINQESLDMAFVITSVIPEPGTFVVAGLGILAIICCHRKWS
jgi:hypothetical protein